MFPLQWKRILNCIVLANDVTPSMPEWDIFTKEVRKEITVKPAKSALQSAEFCA